MGYEHTSRSISPEEATKEQLETRIAEAIEVVESMHKTTWIDSQRLKRIKDILMTGYPF